MLSFEHLYSAKQKVFIVFFSLFLIFFKGSEETAVSVGAGGAIVILSDPKDEFEEMVLKAHSVLPSLASVYKDHFST
jgi:hypothetical protein